MTNAWCHWIIWLIQVVAMLSGVIFLMLGSLVEC